MITAKIRETLAQLDQQQLLVGIEHLLPTQLQTFLSQLEKYDSQLCAKQKDLLGYNPSISSQDVPFRDHERSGNAHDRKVGESLLGQGKVGCLILAGGQGTRLGADIPKGSVAVSPIQKKSLFQIFCERTKVASNWFEQSLQLCMMTSPLNHAQTIDFFQSHDHFGLDPSQISFFQQEMLPFVDDQGRWLLEKPGKMAEGPDGNGHALKLFFESGLWDEYRAKGIEYLNVIVVDNVLADPFDPELIGFAHRMGADVSLKAVERLTSDEKMGTIVQRNAKLKLIEYSEIPPGSMPWTLSNTGLFCISMEFIRHLYQDLHVELPLHLARKSAKVLLDDCSIQKEAYVWKCERFIFDLFDYAKKASVLVYPREKIYAPLKNASGDKSIESVRQALFSHYRDLYRAITGLPPSAHEFELGPAFYYPSEELKRKLSELCLLDQSYIAGA